MQQVEALLLPHLADDEPRRAHPQRLLDQPAQRDLAGALEARLPALHRDHVAAAASFSSKTSSQVTTRSRGGIAAGQAVEQRRLAGLGAAGDQHVEPGRDARRRGSAAACAVSVPSRDQVVEVSRAATTNLRMLTAQCSRVMSGITTCSREPSGSIASTNGLRQVDPATGRLQHPLDQVAHLVAVSIVVVSSAQPVARDEHLARLVDPDLLDARVVEVRCRARTRRPRPRRRPRVRRDPRPGGRPPLSERSS